MPIRTVAPFWTWQSLPRCHCTLVTVLPLFRPHLPRNAGWPPIEPRDYREANLHQRPRNILFKCSRHKQTAARGSGWPLRCTRELYGCARNRAANEPQDGRRFDIKSNPRALEILGAGRLDIVPLAWLCENSPRTPHKSGACNRGSCSTRQDSSEEKLSGRLKIDIDGGVNAKTSFIARSTRPRDHLLADVIDCVSFAPERSACPNDDLFPRATGASFPADENKIACDRAA